MILYSAIQSSVGNHVHYTICKEIKVTWVRLLICQNISVLTCLIITQDLNFKCYEMLYKN